jgi:hypothetical protein
VGGVETNGLLSPALSSRGGEGEDAARFAFGAHFEFGDFKLLAL